MIQKSSVIGTALEVTAGEYFQYELIIAMYVTHWKSQF